MVFLFFSISFSDISEDKTVKGSATIKRKIKNNFFRQFPLSFYIVSQDSHVGKK